MCKCKIQLLIYRVYEEEKWKWNELWLGDFQWATNIFLYGK